MSLDALLPGIEPTPRELVERMSMQERISRAISLLREHEPEDGYYVAFSGGKDSCVIKELVRMAGVKHECRYNQTTIDPPELVRFIKQYHSDVKWDVPKHGNTMVRIVGKSAAPPTRMMRWRCEEYKEHGGKGRTKVMGVRAAESAARAKWREVARDRDKSKVVCPIVYWTDAQVWEFIHAHNLPYCSLYDDGWTRLGCVGCPLNKESRLKEFERWPAFARNWKQAVVGNWRHWKDVPAEDGGKRFQSRFLSGDEFWDWWMQKNTPDTFREGCQTGMLWTNQELDETENE